MLPLAAESGQGGGTAFILPPLYEIFWAAIVLLLILLVVGRYALPRLYAVLDERARRIQEGLDLADKAEQDQADAEKRAARLVDEARREAARIRDNAQSEAKEIVAQARTDDHVGEQASGHLGLTGRGLLGLADQQTNADARAERGQAVADVCESSGGHMWFLLSGADGAGGVRGS